MLSEKNRNAMHIFYFHKDNFISVFFPPKISVLTDQQEEDGDYDSPAVQLS